MQISGHKSVKLEYGVLVEFIKNLPIFNSLSKDELARFVKEVSAVYVSKGSVIYIEQDKADYFYVIKNGWVKLFRETLDGTEAVIDVLTSAHIFAEDSIFNDEKYSSSAQAVEDATIIAVPVALLKSTIYENPAFATSMLAHMSDSRRKREMEIEHITAQNAAQRIGCFILRLCPLEIEKDIVVQLPYDKVLIASRLNMKPETFSRALNKLREKTSIKVVGSRVEIDDIGVLSDFSCSACSSAYPCGDLK